MDLIDRDYLLDNIVEWRAMLTDEKEKKLLTEVMHCIVSFDASQVYDTETFKIN